jgi:hypothetical protein
MVASSQLVAPYLPGEWAAEGVQGRGAAPLHQEHAQPVADLRPRQGWRHLLTPGGCPEHKPHREQGQGQGMMPALPGTPLVRIHAAVPLAALEAGGTTRAAVEDPCHLWSRRLLQLPLGPMRRREVIPGSRATVVLQGIRRGGPLHRAGVRSRTPGDYQPRLRPRPFPCQMGLPAARDHLKLHGPVLPVAHRHARPPLWVAADQLSVALSRGRVAKKKKALHRIDTSTVIRNIQISENTSDTSCERKERYAHGQARSQPADRHSQEAL